MIVLGITGGIGSGKSTISNILTVLGIPVYIADDEGKKLNNTSPIIKEKLTTLFGKDLYENGILNKAKLASIIFSDNEALQKVNKIIHPEIEKHFLEWIKFNSNQKVIACESAILFESGFNKHVDKTVTVYSSLEIRIKRITKRDNCSAEKAQERINSQMPDEKKIELSDFVIVNNESESLIRQTIDLLDKLTKNEF